MSVAFRIISSHSDIIPKTWEASIGLGIRLVVTRHIDYEPDAWIARSQPSILDMVVLQSKDIEEAKAEAVELLVSRCKQIIRECEDGKQNTSDNTGNDDILAMKLMDKEGHISDLFFNLDSSDCVISERGHFVGWDEEKLTEKALFMLSTLKGLGVSNLPTPQELVDNFLKRV
jgi:hypothetical protein